MRNQGRKKRASQAAPSEAERRPLSVPPPVLHSLSDWFLQRSQRVGVHRLPGQQRHECRRCLHVRLQCRLHHQRRDWIGPGLHRSVY